MSSAPASVSSPLPDLGAALMEPDFTTFARLYDEGLPQVVLERLVAYL